MKTTGLALAAFGLVLATLDLVPAPLAVVVFAGGVLVVAGAIAWVRLDARSHASPSVADVVPDIARRAS